MPESPSGPIRLDSGIIDLERRRFVRADGETRLSANEVALLTYLLARPGKPVSRDELLSEVWGYRPGLATRAVDQCVSRLRNKLEADPRTPRHLKSVYGTGYVLELDAPDEVPSPPESVRVLDPRRCNLPPLEGRTIGREALLAEVVAALQDADGPVLLSGPPGVGKTRLAHEVAAALLPSLPGGAWLIALHGASGLRRLYSGLVSALALPVEPGAEPEPEAGRLGAALAVRGPVLLILDDCGSLEGPAWAWLERLQAASPEARWLLTAQRPPIRAGARRVQVPPLSPSEGLALYLHEASRRRPALAYRDPSDPTLQALVSLLDGLPLALELAAGLAAVEDPESLLRSLRTDAQATLRGVDRALARSWQRLSALEQHDLASLAVFPEAFPTAAAAAVLGSAERAVPLVARGLLARRGNQLALLHRVRAYALARLRERSDWQQRAEQAALGWALRQAEARVQDLEGSGRIEALVELRRLRVTLEALLARAQGRYREGAVRLGLVLDRLLQLEGPLAQRFESAELMVEEARALGDPTWLVRALLRLAEASCELGEHLAAAHSLDEALALCGQLADAGRSRPELELRVLLHRAEVERLAGRPAEAAQWLSRADEVRRSGPAGRVDVAIAHGRVAMELGDLDTADRRLLEAVRGARRMGRGRRLAIALLNLGTCCLARGDLAEAERRFGEGADLLDELGAESLRASALGNLGTVRYDRGDLQGAAEAYALALASARATGQRRFEINVLCWSASLAHEQGDSERGREGFARALDLLRETPNLRTEGFARAGLGVIDHDTGRLEQALHSYERARACFAEAGDRLAGASVGVTLAALLAEQGAVERAEAMLDEAVHEAGQPPPELVATLSDMFRGTIELARARNAPPQEAADLRRQALARLELGDQRAECRLARRVLRRMLAEGPGEPCPHE